MIAVATSLLQRALETGVLPTTKTEWVAFTISFVIGVALDFVGWWAFWPASFDRYVTRPVRRLLAAHTTDDDGQGDDDPDGGGFAMWAWCPVCASYRLNEDEPCPYCATPLDEGAHVDEAA
jgi:hypothetical protein